MAPVVANSSLMSSVKAGSIQLGHRVVMSAMTRLRNDPEKETPRDLNVEYYKQRASNGGLIVSECMRINPMSRGYIRSPGMFTDDDVKSWSRVVSAVHSKAGYIVAQIFHPGRVAHSSLLPGGALPEAPSAVKPQGKLHVEGGKADYETPQVMSADRIKEVVRDFAYAAKQAVKGAGFDGVEIHAGNGYLIQEFMAEKTNLRDDEYGGTLEKRMRFLLEVIDACCEEVGSDKVAVKLQPGVTFSDLIEDPADVAAQVEYLGPELSRRNLQYVCMSSLCYEPYFRFAGLEQPHLDYDVFQKMRQAYSGHLMINGGLDVAKAEEYVSTSVADSVAFAVLFLANANLPDLIGAGKQLDTGGMNPKVWYGKDPATDHVGYTDWALQEV